MRQVVSATKEENEREYRVLDQMLTMHALLRDRLERRAFWLNTSLVGAALVLCVFGFVGDDTLLALALHPAMTRFVLGFVAVFVLVLSITEFRVDWKSASGKHGEAAHRLCALKAQFRKCFAETGGTDAKKNGRLSTEYEKAMRALLPIPERWFSRLKAEYQMKKLLSQRITKHPKTPIWFLRLQLRLEGVAEAWKQRKDPANGTDAKVAAH